MRWSHIRFSPWVPWAERDEKEGLDVPGVYLLGRFSTRPRYPARPTDRRVVYMGETHYQTLKVRLRAFNRSAFKEASGHSGGVNCRSLLKRVSPSQLYFSTWFPKGEDDHLRTAVILYVERKLILEFVKANGRPPCCNKE